MDGWIEKCRSGMHFKGVRCIKAYVMGRYDLHKDERMIYGMIPISLPTIHLDTRADIIRYIISQQSKLIKCDRRIIDSCLPYIVLCREYRLSLSPPQDT